MSVSHRITPQLPAPVKLIPGRLIGIDPGLERTGYALLSADRAADPPRIIEAGVIRLVRQHTLAARLAHLATSLAELLETHRPAALVCEELYAHYRHPRTAILMGHARGVILATAARYGLDVLPVAAKQAKKFVTGSGRAGKVQVQRAVAATLGLAALPEPHDVADAIAIALCGLRLREAWGAVPAAEVRR